MNLNTLSTPVRIDMVLIGFARFSWIQGGEEISGHILWPQKKSDYVTSTDTDREFEYGLSSVPNGTPGGLGANQFRSGGAEIWVIAGRVGKNMHSEKLTVSNDSCSLMGSKETTVQTNSFQIP